MRIAFATREYPPETAWGGIGSFYFSLANSLVEAGHEVEVFAQALETEGTILDDNGVMVHRVLGLKNGFGEKAGGSLAQSDDIGLFSLGMAFAMHDAVAARHGECPFDIIEGHEHLGINSLINQSGFIDAVTITRYHSAYHTLVRRGLVTWPQSRLIEAIEYAAIKSANYRVSTSSVISKAVQEDFGVEEAEIIIPNFVKSVDYHSNWAAKKNQILFVGRLALNHKRPDVAVNAFVKIAKKFPDYEMLIIGLDQEMPEHGTVWAFCEKLIPRNLKTRIKYLGPKSQDEVYHYMGESKGILMPSDFESFGMVAVEALQHECLPFVSSDTATADIVHDPLLICQKGSADSFALKIVSALSDDQRASEIAKSGRAHALEVFSEVSVISENIRFFQSVATKPRQVTSLNHKPIRKSSEAMENWPIVSIIVPNYNGARFIGETIESITTQDYPNLEIIVVDGASRDNSVKIAQKFPDVKVISMPDYGQAHAINRGMLLAKGEILAYLNSDDVYKPGAIRTVVEHFRLRPEIKVLMGECDYLDEKSDIIGHLRPKFSGAEGIVKYWGWDNWHCIPQQSTFWRREIMERIGLFDTERHFVMDLDYWIRVARMYPFHIVPETLAAFRLVAGTKTVSNTDKMYSEELQTFYKYRSLLPKGTRFSATIQCNKHFSERILGFAEHLFLEYKLLRKPLLLALVSVKRYLPRVFDLRFIMLLTHFGAHALGHGQSFEKLHRKVLGYLWRKAND
jgi:glycosyltransferase involved in cell wall biosynthesis